MKILAFDATALNIELATFPPFVTLREMSKYPSSVDPK